MKACWRLLTFGGSSALALAVLLACGGGGGGSTSADTPEEYARAFCEAFGIYGEDFVEIVHLGEDIATNAGDPSASLESLDQLVGRAEPTFRGLADDLGDIEPPESIQSQHEQIVTSFSDGADALAGIEDVGERPLDEAVEQLEAVSAEMDRFGQAFDTLEDPPPEFQDAFENEEACQELDETFQDL